MQPKQGGLNETAVSAPSEIAAATRDNRLAGERARPEGWAISKRPLRILLLGWADLSAQAREGSGYNWNASELASGLALSGHEVFYLRSGMDYTLLPPGPYVRFQKNWRGISCHALFNSRNVSPSYPNFHNVHRDMSSPNDMKAVLAWCGEIKPDVIHIHSLEGLPLDLIGELRAGGYKVVVTPHNYWYVCSQVDLLHDEREVCLDFEGGKKCVGCILAPRPARIRLARALEQIPRLRRIVRFGYRIAKKLRAILLRKQNITASYNSAGNELLPDPELALGFEIGDPRLHNGTIDHGLRQTPFDKICQPAQAPADMNQKVLTALRKPLTVVNAYGERRARGIAMLNQANWVTPPSRFMCRAYEATGVDSARLRHVPLGQPHFDQIHRRAKLSPYYDVRPWDAHSARRPLRVAFWGTTRNNKGLAVLARAIEVLPKEIRQRCHFTIHASGPDWSFRKLLSFFPEVSFLGGYDQLQLIAGSGEFDVAVLPFIWLENSPLVMLECLHAGKFLISSRLGGPVDWLHEPGSAKSAGNGGLGNGLMFPGGDEKALADCIGQVVRGEVVLPSPREIHAVSELCSYPQHVALVEAMYQELQQSDLEQPAAGVAQRLAA